MASFSSIISIFLLLAIFTTATASKPQDSFQLLSYHNGPLLSGKISVNLIWYGTFSPSQRAIVSDFISSLSSPKTPNPSVSTWWATLSKYYPTSTKLSTLSLSSQIMDPTYSLGKSLSSQNIQTLASRGPHSNAVNVVLTSSDVTVDRFCMSTCGSHGSIKSTTPVKGSKSKKRPTFAYIWVGNSETQCPGQCAWPFHQPTYGPQTSPLVAPNGDVGMDGVVINLATLLAGTTTNPFGNGYFQGPKEAPLEAASACPGVYGQGAYPGYAGNLLVDSVSGGSYNAECANGRKYLLPAIYDPSTSRCSTLV